MDIEQVFDGFLSAARKRGIVLNYVQIRQGGDIVLDWGRLSQKTRLNTYSVCKSFISVAAGIAMDEHILDINERLCDSFGEYLPKNPSDNLTQIKVRHLLTMTTGIADPLFFTDDDTRYVTRDWAAYFFNANFSNPPGEKFLYSNFNTYMLSRLIEKKCGMDMMEYLTPRLFDPLKVYSPDWTRCPMGHIHAANGLYVTIDELGNFGQMLLDGGVFEGHRIVSKDYLDKACANQLPESMGVKYGYQFWINPDGCSYRADGKYGQYVFVLPKKDMVVAVQSLDCGDVMDLVWSKLIEKLD